MPKDVDTLSAAFAGSAVLAASGWLLAAWLAIKLWAANDYIRLLQANRVETHDKR